MSATEIWSSVISLRSAEHAQLGLPAFLDLFNESWAFVVRCEVIARRMIVGLRGVVVSQAKLFLQAFHQHRISDSAKMVEDEVWGQVEVSPESQRQVDIIVNAAVSNPMELLLKSDPSSGSRVNGSAIQGIPPSGRAKQPNAKLLIIEERSYYVVGATLQVMELVVDYLKVIVNISLLTTDTMSKVIEFLKVCLTTGFSFDGCQPLFSSLVFQLPNLPSCPRCRGNALGWIEEHYGQTSRQVFMFGS